MNNKDKTQNCYIETLLMSMFYTTHNESMLTVKSNYNMYLDDVIKFYFINVVRSGTLISVESVRIIENFCDKLGWNVKNTNNSVIVNFYSFLLDKLKGDKIKIKKETVYNIPDIKNTVSLYEESLNYIPLILPVNSGTEISVKKMLYDWMYSELKYTDKNKKETSFDVNKISNTPNMLALYINRYQNVYDDKLKKIVVQKNSTDVIIQKRVSPFHNNNSNNSNNPEWLFHSAICYKQCINSNDSYYYCLLVHKDEHFIFDPKVNCLLTPVKMHNKQTTDKIKKECVLLLYLLNK